MLETTRDYSKYPKEFGGHTSEQCFYSLNFQEKYLFFFFPQEIAIHTPEADNSRSG